MLFCFYLLLAGNISAVSGFTPVTYPARVSSECGPYDPLQDEQLTVALSQVQQHLDPPGCNPSKNRSCHEILHCFSSAPSDYYQIIAPNGSLVQVYCDMEGISCGGKRGWTRIDYVNMSQSGAICPQGLTQKIFSGLPLCGRNSNSAGCQSSFFSTLGINYSNVCGQLRGYQWGTPSAFYDAVGNSIDQIYVEGTSITYGSSGFRKHIWTYANGYSLSLFNSCPCSTNQNRQTPSFVGNDYYCETAYHESNSNPVFQFFPNDPLWDGQQCPGEEAPCCAHPNMPWFTKTLSETTNEDIEVRLCADQPTNDEDTLLQVIELFVL